MFYWQEFKGKLLLRYSKTEEIQTYKHDQNLTNDWPQDVGFEYSALILNLANSEGNHQSGGNTGLFRHLTFYLWTLSLQNPDPPNHSHLGDHRLGNKTKGRNYVPVYTLMPGFWRLILFLYSHCNDCSLSGYIYIQQLCKQIAFW